MEDFKIITGKDLTYDIYRKTWELDNNTFNMENRISENLAKTFFDNTNGSTIVLWDCKKDDLVGYISPFLMKNSFFDAYINTDKSFKTISTKDFYDIENEQSGEANIYIFSTVVKEAYRDRVLSLDKNSGFYKKSAFRVLNETMLDWVCDIKNKLSLNYIFSEKVTDDGEKYLRSLKMEPCFDLKDDSKFAVLFNPGCFSRCSNINKLYKLYTNDSVRKPYKPSYFKEHEYLSIKNNHLYYFDIDLCELAEKYSTPLEVSYLDIIGDKVKYLKGLFEKKIAKYGYPAEYKYAYATKANYYSETILTAHKYVDYLETSSAYDIDIMIDLAERGVLKKGYTVICNGFKNDKYIKSISKLLKLGINVIPIIENEFELHKLKSIKEKFNVGVRYNSDFESRLIKNNFKDKEEFDNRFGFDKFTIKKVCEEINKTPNMNLQVFHFHFGGTIGNINNYLKGYRNIFSVFCELKQDYPSLEYFDFGGGMPVKYSITYNFDYDSLIDGMICISNELSQKYNIVPPNLIGEHGRFTVADSGFMLYKVDFTKELNYKYWYILNTSLMNMTPDIWGIQQDFTIMPLNLLDRKTIPVCLGGETCDPDDRYFLNESNIKIFMPKIEEGESLYVGIFATGAYQDIISGISGVHHCLIPEGKELIIYSNKGKRVYYEVNEKQTTKDILDVLDYRSEHIKKFL